MEIILLEICLSNLNLFKLICIFFFIPLIVNGCLNLVILSQQKPSAIKDSLKLK